MRAQRGGDGVLSGGSRILLDRFFIVSVWNTDFQRTIKTPAFGQMREKKRGINMATKIVALELENVKRVSLVNLEFSPSRIDRHRRQKRTGENIRYWTLSATH